MDVFDLWARIGLDDSEYQKGISGAKATAANFASQLGTGIKNAAAVGAKALAAISTVAATGITAMTTAAINNFADYEQLVGGVETLFKNSADNVMYYAKNAYKTAGMSANEYMETVTSFSASLLQGLGSDTEAASAIANKAITDMSDNANKMGTDMSMIQNAYQGFAKQNYTMLDNLKLGYGGTQAEMARLINDSGVLGDSIEVTAKTVNEVSFDKIIEAIHVVQTEMGITGTTAKEAASTISGSMASAKAAWNNMLTGIADENANFRELTTNLVNSVVTVGDNLLPRVEVAMNGVVQLVEGLAPKIIEKVPGLISSLVPNLLSGVDSIVNSMVQVLPEAVGAIGTALLNQSDYLIQSVFDLVLLMGEALADGADGLVDGAATLIESLSMWIVEYGSVLFDTGVELVSSIAAAIVENAPRVWEAFQSLFSGLGLESVPDLISTGLTMVRGLSESLRTNAGLMVDAGIQLVMNLAQGVADSFPIIIENVPTIVSNIAGVINDNAPKIFTAAVQLIWTLVSGLLESVPVIIENMPQIIAAVWDTITAVNWIDLGINIITGLKDGILKMAAAVKTAVDNVMKNPIQYLQQLVNNFKTMGSNLMNFFGSGIRGMAGSVYSAVQSAISEAINWIRSLPSQALTWGRDLIDNFVSGIRAKISAVTSVISSVAQEVQDYIGFSEPDKGPLSNFHTYAPDMMALFAQGIRDNERLITDQVAKSFAIKPKMSVDPEELLNDESFWNNDPQPRNGSGVFNFYFTIGGDVDDVSKAKRYGRIIGEEARKAIREKGGVPA